MLPRNESRIPSKRSLSSSCADVGGRVVALLLDAHRTFDGLTDFVLGRLALLRVHRLQVFFAETERFEDLRAAIDQRRTVKLQIAYEQGGQRKQYVEEVGPGPSLVIAGAGHVGQALADLASKLEFRVAVIDDREDYASAARFPAAGECIVGDIEAELRRYPIDPSTYIVIVTRGHARDGQALLAVIDSPARYIGMIGSKRKIKTIFDDLAASGISVDRLARVHAPIGYEIGAVTVNEIAVSIAAELIAVRRNDASGEPARAMKIDPQQLHQWLARPERPV